MHVNGALVSEKHCSMFNANKLLYCIVFLNQDIRLCYGYSKEPSQRAYVKADG